MKIEKFDVFSKENLGSVRTAYSTENGEPWFVAKDVCECLGVNNSRQALTRLMDDEKDVILNDTLGGKQKMSVISESGLYTLIMSARKKEAVDFQRWVTREVLPSIRKHGVYAAGQEDMSTETRDEIFAAVEAITKKKVAFENDSNYWFSMYEKLLAEYAEIKEALVASKRYLPKENGGLKPAASDAKEGFILREEIGKDGVWTDRQMFVQNIKAGSVYSIVEREMR